MAITKTPFEVLRDYEKRALIHAVGLPAQVLAQGAWSGIAFRMADADLVAQIGDVVELMEVPSVTRVPGAAEWVRGIANVRGQLVPIVDLRQFLTGEATNIGKATRVLVLAQAGGNVGVLIDEIRGQRHFEEEERSEDRQYEDHAIGRYVRDEYEKGEEHWAAFDASALMADPAFQQAGA